jgi:hypothetical protein
MGIGNTGTVEMHIRNARNELPKGAIADQEVLQVRNAVEELAAGLDDLLSVVIDLMKKAR